MGWGALSVSPYAQPGSMNRPTLPANSAFPQVGVYPLTRVVALCVGMPSDATKRHWNGEWQRSSDARMTICKRHKRRKTDKRPPLGPGYTEGSDTEQPVDAAVRGALR